jgi:chemotaxis protein CheZ
MGEPRRVFRIEQMAASRFRGFSQDNLVPTARTALMNEINALRAMLACAGTPRQSDKNAAATRLTSELDRIASAMGKEQHAASMMRISRELEAVVNGTEQATQKVLAAAEEIDQLANNLSAALRGKIEQGIAQDIQDFVIQIFESCNFQDLAGQRITKVMATLRMIEEQIANISDAVKTASTAARQDGVQKLHGPRLDCDPDHASQSEIDSMF